MLWCKVLYFWQLHGLHIPCSDVATAMLVCWCAQYVHCSHLDTNGMGTGILTHVQSATNCMNIVVPLQAMQRATPKSKANDERFSVLVLLPVLLCLQHGAAGVTLPDSSCKHYFKNGT